MTSQICDSLLALLTIFFDYEIVFHSYPNNYNNNDVQVYSDA